VSQLKQRPVFSEQWPDTWRQALVKGKQHLAKIDAIRSSKTTLADILKQDRVLYNWYESIH
jgi:hypothetical protein